jgi:hypothetical protein
MGKTVGQHLRILTENLKILKTHKNSYTGPLCITNAEYGGHDQVILSFSQFLPTNTKFQSVFAANWRFSVKP